jgi:hypothetical protein
MVLELTFCFFLGARRGSLVEIIGTNRGVGQHSDNVWHHFQDAATHKEKRFLAIGLLHPDRTGLELGDQWRVAGTDTELAYRAGGENHRGLTGENFLLCGYDVTMNSMFHEPAEFV